MKMDDVYLLRKENINDIQNSQLLNETLFHNANGYLGVRSNYEEGYKNGGPTIRGSYINGFYDFVQMEQSEKLCGLVEEKQTILNITDVQGIKCFVDDEQVFLSDEQIDNSYRELDMKKGVTKRVFSWKSSSGKWVDFEVIRMTSFAMLPLFTIDYKVIPRQACHVRIVSTQEGNVMNFCDPSDPRMAADSHNYLHLREKKVTEHGYSIIISSTSKSGLLLASCVSHEHKQSDLGEYVEYETGIEYHFEMDAEAHETLQMIKYAVFCDSRRYRDVYKASIEKMKEARQIGVKNFYIKQEKYLSQYWQNCDIQIRGNTELQKSVLYNLYQLIQSVGKDAYSNIAAKGLSGEGYEGHYFWDTEMYIFPLFLLTNPEIARNLLLFRYQILDYARENAKIAGHKKGILYAWRTIMGKECSGYYPAGTAQYHINGDIAYAIISYYLVTGDLDFILNYGMEILIETSRLWIDMGNYADGTFHINTVTGPDEYTCLVNDNYYTNALAKYNLEWTIKFDQILKESKTYKQLKSKLELSDEELLAFSEASDHMTLLYDKNLGINPQDDSFLKKKVWEVSQISKDEKPLLLHYHPMHLYRYQICKQADTVMSHFVLEDYQSYSVMKRTFEYYEKITTHDSSLSTCIFSIMASKLNMPQKALEYFGDSYKLDLYNLHHNTEVGIHTANMGGTYMTIVYGFGGLRIKEDGIHIAPVLPEGWDGYCFKIHYRGSKLKVENNVQNCQIKVMDGAAQEMVIYGKRYYIADILSIELNRQ